VCLFVCARSEADVLSLLGALTAAGAGPRLVLLGGIGALQSFKSNRAPSVALHAAIDDAMRPLFAFAGQTQAQHQTQQQSSSSAAAGTTVPVSSDPAAGADAARALHQHRREQQQAVVDTANVTAAAATAASLAFAAASASSASPALDAERVTQHHLVTAAPSFVPLPVGSDRAPLVALTAHSAANTHSNSNATATVAWSGFSAAVNAEVAAASDSALLAHLATVRAASAASSSSQQQHHANVTVTEGYSAEALGFSSARTAYASSTQSPSQSPARSSSQSSQPPPLLCAAGFRFAPIALSRADERCVFELGLRMRMHDGHSVRGAVMQVRDSIVNVSVV
jgi:hypothetical protein